MVQVVEALTCRDIVSFMWNFYKKLYATTDYSLVIPYGLQVAWGVIFSIRKPFIDVLQSVVENETRIFAAFCGLLL